MTDNAPAPRKATWRMGARQRERLQWAVVAFICVLLFLALRPYFLHMVQVRDFQTCQSNILQISRGISLYSDDADGALPLGNAWATSVQGYLAARSGTGFKVKDLFHCPRDKSGGEASYAWNSVLDGYAPTHQNMSDAALKELEKAGRPERVILVFEKHGSALNTHTKLFGYDDLAKELTLPHRISQETGPTASVITGGQKPTSVTADRLAGRAGQNF